MARRAIQSTRRPSPDWLSTLTRFFGYITAPPAPIGILGDVLAAAVNPNVGAWILSPARGYLHQHSRASRASSRHAKRQVAATGERR